jgi:2-methylcitrate dehydratase PrpD
MSDYLDRLAGFVAATRFDALPASAIAAAKLVLLDTLGAILAGSAQPENGRLARVAAARGATGTATLIGHAARAETCWAALVNATAGVALEMDEGNRLGGGHPAIHTLPGLLAVAEEARADGPHFLEALIAGYEVGSRVGGATTPRGNVHSHGTWGTISTAVAVARLAGAAPAQIREAINLAASMSPANTWTPALEGATIRNLYPGRSAFQGILAVELQRCGFTALDDGPADVYGTLLAEAFAPAAAVTGLDAVGAGQPYRIEQNYFKLHACCRYNHFALEAIAALRARRSLRAEDVARVEVVTIPFGLRMAEPAPTSPLGARFSIPYAVAAALVLGRTDVTAFESPALEDPRVRALARRVAVSVDPKMSPRSAGDPTARVRVLLRDGTALDAEASVPRGDAVNPVPSAEIEGKFRLLAEPALGAAGSREAAETVHRVETLKDVRDLTARLTRG